MRRFEHVEHGASSVLDFGRPTRGGGGAGLARRDGGRAGVKFWPLRDL